MSCRVWERIQARCRHAGKWRGWGNERWTSVQHFRFRLGRWRRHRATDHRTTNPHPRVRLLILTWIHVRSINRVFRSFLQNMTALTFLPMLYMWTDASILSYVKMLSYAKDLIPDICWQHLNNWLNAVSRKFMCILGVVCWPLKLKRRPLMWRRSWWACRSTLKAPINCWWTSIPTTSFSQ